MVSNEDFLKALELEEKYVPKSLTPYIRSLEQKGVSSEEINRILPSWQAPASFGVDVKEALDRSLGCLIGLAIGDALGTTLEFQARDKSIVSSMQGGGVFNLAPGEWTDDTSMALCLGDTYLKEKEYSPKLFMKYLSQWYRSGKNSHNGRCFDIGNTTRFAIESFEKEGVSWRGNTDPTTSGNAPIIRLAPSAVFGRKSFHQTYRDAEAQSQATHKSQDSVSATQLLSKQLHTAVNGGIKEEALAPHIMPFPPNVMKINAGLYKEKSRDQIQSSGYIIHTLEAANWAVWNTDNFKDALLLAVNLADDADSVGATTGQLAGALYGYSSIPEEWLDKLVWHDKIVDMATTLFKEAPEDGDWVYIDQNDLDSFL